MFEIQEGFYGVISEEGIQCYGIDVPAIEVALGVIFLGFADVASFGVEDDGDF